MLAANSNSSNSRPILTLTAGTAASVAMAAAASIASQNAENEENVRIGVNTHGPNDKTEINKAVTKVLEGYDWTLVPIATK